MVFHSKLKNLLRKRLEAPGKEKEVDSLIWEKYGEETTVILTDLSGFTRLTKEKGIIYFLSLIQKQEDILAPLIKEFSGKIIKQEGDSFFIIFPTPQSALQCALKTRENFNNFNETCDERGKITINMGIASGKALVFQDDLFGNPVNIASKLGEDIACNGEILISEEVYKTIKEYFNKRRFVKHCKTVSQVQLTYFSVM